MNLPSCPWCLGRRVEDALRWPTTGWGCSWCGEMLGLQLEPIPRVASSTDDAVDTTPEKV